MTGIAIKDGGIVTDGDGICLGCCDYVGGSPPTDCCCFLDPTTFAWDTIRTFAQGDLCEDGGNTFESVQNGNQDHVTSDTDWWTHVSASASCGNADWDAFPPYGGPAKTPRVFTATVYLTFPSSASYTYYSAANDIRNNIDWPAGGAPCGWRTDPTIYVPDGPSNHFKVGSELMHGLCAPTPPEEWWVEYNLRRYGNDCTRSDAYFYVGDIAATIQAIPCLGVGTLADCSIAGTLSVADGEAGICIKRLTATEPSIWESGTGVLSWHPGKILEWDNSTGYIVGDIVAWEGVFYICIADNTNQEPPNVTYWDIV